MNQTGNTILITGGGSGIGEALAQRFHDNNNTVIIAGRRGEALLRAAEGRPNMHAMTLDIGSAEGIADFARLDYLHRTQKEGWCNWDNDRQPWLATGQCPSDEWKGA